MPKTSEQRLYRRGPMRKVWPSPPKPARRRAAGAPTPSTAARRARLARGRLAAHTHQVAIDAAAVNYVDLGERRPPGRLRPRPGRLLAELAREPSHRSRRSTASIALDLPGFGRSQMPAEPITITRLRAHGRRALRPARPRRRRARRQLDGRLHGGRAAIRHPDRVERLVLVDAAGISTALERNPVAERLGRFAGHRRGRRRHARPRAGDAHDPPPRVPPRRAGAVARHPTRSRATSSPSSCTRSVRPGFTPRSGDHRLRLHGPPR